ncbi:hypothetical protein FACS1894110_22800 [Spirochaetia bacterium]|nr:hypothetical protein FACS1894110_22800 [Spirochaetia bacterium]
MTNNKNKYKINNMKKCSLFVFLTCILAGNLSANGIADVSFYPSPDPQIELPRELVGVFKFVYEYPNAFDYLVFGFIEIYEDNKYWWRGVDSGQEWGYVIEEKGDYYFFPLGSGSYPSKEGYYIDEKTKITLIENGFSFIGSKRAHNLEFVTVRSDLESEKVEREKYRERIKDRRMQ